MKKCGMAVIAACCLIVFATELQAAHGWIKGNDPEYWKDACIIYARVMAVKGDQAKTDLELRVLATVTGSLDPATESTITTRTTVGPESEISEVPKPNSCAIFVVVKRPWGYGVESDPILFMPDHSGIVPVVGDPTPIMEQILKALQKVRTKKP